MGLTGLEIFKQLPKKNCKECGQPTCLAFAMQLAAGKASLDACPYVSDAAKEALDAASAPPVELVSIGAGEKAIELGNETVMFRHDKRFEHPTAITIKVKDTEDVKAKVEKINKLVFDRVGQTHEVSMVAVVNDSGDAAKFADAVKTAQDNTVYPLMLVTSDVAAMEKALEVAGENKPLIYAADENNYEDMTNLAKKYEAPLAVKGNNLNSLAELVEKVKGLGYKKLFIDSGATEMAQMVADQVQMRRQALKLFRPFGFPTIAFACNDNPVVESMNAGTLIAKYAAVVVIDSAEPEYVLPLITIRLNVYTDPQRPIAVETKIYEILNPGPDAPVLITTNFSLSFFCVAGDTEAARQPAYIIPIDTDGISVLTAWAAGSLTPESISETVKKLGVMDKVDHNKIILPGGVAVLSGQTQELSGCEVVVGPRDSAALPSFFKQVWNQ